MSAAGPRLPASWRSPFVMLVGGLALLGLALRLPSLNDSLFGDELSTYFIVAGGHGPRNVIDFVRTSQEFTPPLFFELSWATNRIGDSVEALRLPSLLAGVGAIPLTYLIGLRTVRREAALVAAALVALSPFMIFFSTEARAYSLEVFLLLLSTYGLLRASAGEGWGWWVLYAASGCAVMYTHYTGAFVLGGQFAWAFFARPDARRGLILSSLGAVIAFLPWYPSFRDDGNAPGTNILDIIHPFTWPTVRTDLARWSVSGGINTVGSVPGYTAVWLIGAGLVAGLAGLVLRVWKRRTWRPSSGLVLVLLLAIVAPVGAIVYSSLTFSVFIPRNLIGSWPFLALSAGALVTAASARWARIGAAALLIAGFAIGAAKMTDPANQRSDYASAVSFIESTGRPGDPVVEFPLPTPSAQTSLEAALAPYGEMVPKDHKVFDLSIGTLRARLDARAPGGPELFAPLQPTPPDVIAKRAARLGRGGKIFLVTLGSSPLSVIQLGGLGAHTAEFLADLPPRFKLAETRIFPGAGFLQVAVNVFEDTGPTR